MPSLRRYFIELSFRGTAYHGWQRQHNALTVQEVLEQALQTATGREVLTASCCRTDTGVHALQMFVHADLDENLDAYRFTHQLNGILPDDISVAGIVAVDAGAHARYDAVQRTYGYYGYRQKNALLSGWAAPFHYDLDPDPINEACEHLLKQSDFACFAKVGSDVKSTECRVTLAEWKHADGLHQFNISANRFLRGMVRAVVGTLAAVGRGGLSPDDFGKIIASGDRKATGPQAPACGLYLEHVEYPHFSSAPLPGFPFRI